MPISPNEQGTSGDAIDLLTTQHQEVKRLVLPARSSRPGTSPNLRVTGAPVVRTETAEEEIVYPALRSIEPDGEQIAEQRKAEEAQAKRALSDLEKLGIDGQGFDSRLEEFRRDVLDHAESEEREVFPRLRNSLEPEELRSMRAALEMAEQMAPTHPHPHGPKSAVGNMAVGPFVAVADRVRDARRRNKRS